MELRKESITGQVRDDRGLDLEKWVDVRYISEVNQRTWRLIGSWGMRRRKGSGMSNGLFEGIIYRVEKIAGKADLQYK